MSASQYKLSYFDIRGLAEVPRLLLHAANVSFTDDRVTFSKNADGTFNRGDWDTVRKPLTPYGQMPVLTLTDGTQIAQSGAIIRYIAKHHGLNGANDTQAAQIDAGFEHLLDVRRSYHLHKSDAAKVAEFWAKGLNADITDFEKNIQGSYFVGNQVSYVDIYLYYLVWGLLHDNKDVTEKVVAGHPKVKAIFESVPKIKGIADWVAKRPDTIF